MTSNTRVIRPSVPSAFNDTLDQVANRSVRDQNASLESFSRVQIINGSLLSKISLSTTTSIIKHLLGRPYIGWIVVDRDQPAIVMRDTSSPMDPSLYLPLQSNIPVSVSLWVF